MKDPILVWTDGSVFPNPGEGGWATLLVFNGVARVIGGYEPVKTTNNRMETQALIEALKALRKPSDVVVFSDSQYLQMCFKTIKKGSDSLPKLNQDLWGVVRVLSSNHKIRIDWLRGHDGDSMNELCDAVAGYCREHKKNIDRRLQSESLGTMRPKAVRKNGLP